jgi:hypothetical protein
MIGKLQDSLKIYEVADMDFKNGSERKQDRLPVRVHESLFFNETLSQLSLVNETTEEIVASIKKSNDIYYRNATGDWWNSNRLRTENFVQNYRSHFVNADQISNEKLFLKIGGLHAAKGLNNYNRYDLGNIIYETSRLTGRKSCHMVVLDRYWMNAANEVEDVLQDSTSWYGTNFQQILNVGKPDEWSVIDMDKIRKQGLYKKEVNERVRDYFERYDIVIIPPVDREPTLNIKD